MSHRTRSLTLVLLFVLLMGAALEAAAQRRGGVGRGASPDVRQGISMVSGVDVFRRRVTLGDDVYRVPEETRILDLNGQTVRLEDLRALDQRPGELVPLEELDWLRFEAIRKRGGWSLTAATVLDGPVE